MGLGVGTINGTKVYGTSLNNTDIFPGVYSANGVLFGGGVFTGIGLGVTFHSDKRGFSIPADVDIRWRILRKKKISPILLAQGGLEYSNGGAGTLFIAEGLGFSAKVNSKLSIHLIVNHSFMATSRALLPSGTD
ncbi:MAG: hypothetical protein K1X82_09125 [Bacteroidia bacterium]|nr:hypothetical protein [Bacteroidia bacterium]